MSDPQVPSPYGEDLLDDLLGSRVAIQSTPLDWFKTNTNEQPGEDRQVPYEDELAHDNNGAIYVLTRDEAGNVVPKSHSVEVYNKIRDMEESGIFDNAMAFMFNREIYKLYFDIERLVVKSNNELVFDESYRYYAIRSGQLLENGEYKYYTGIRSNDGSGTVISNFVDMKLKTGENGNYRTFETGALLEPLTHGKNYIVEFYDADRIIIKHLVFQAISVRDISFDMTPDTAIVDIEIHSTNTYEDSPHKVSLFQHQSYRDLIFKVYAKYANGQIKDITHEKNTKLTIEGLEDITTDIVTGSVIGDNDPVPPQTFEINYLLSQASYVSGEHINADTLTITRKIEVYIKENRAEVPISILPLATKFVDATNRTGVKLKIYALYVSDTNKEGFLRDITHYFRNYGSIQEFEYNANLNTLIGGISTLGKANTYFIEVPYGYNSSASFSFVLREYEFDDIHVKFMIHKNSTDDLYKPLYSAVYSGSGGVTLRLDKYQKLTPGGGADGLPITLTSTYLENNFSLSQKDGSNPIKPTHFTVRNGFDPDYVYARNIEIANVAQNFAITMDLNYSISEQDPILIEFNHLYYDNDIVVKSICTGAAMFYAGYSA